MYLPQASPFYFYFLPVFFLCWKYTMDHDRSLHDRRCLIQVGNAIFGASEGEPSKDDKQLLDGLAGRSDAESAGKNSDWQKELVENAGNAVIKPPADT